jgi:hypothetical protein
MEVTTHSTVFSDMTPYNLVETYYTVLQVPTGSVYKIQNSSSLKMDTAYSSETATSY